MNAAPIQVSNQLNGVRYEIRGPLARRALEMERGGHEVIKLNIGNPGPFGFRTPASMRLAVAEHLQASEGYCPSSKGIFPAREAVVMQQQERGILDIDIEDVFIGNGVSELIMMCMRALLNTGDEVLVPSPDYPLWTAAVTIHGGKAVHYPCRPEQAFMPDPAELAGLITPRTKALVLINPNNPTGAVYPQALLKELVAVAEARDLVIFADEIYGEMCYDDATFTPLAPMVKNTLCATFSGLSKIYRACGYRVGWVSFSGVRDRARDYLLACDLLASLRLCSNVPGQWAVQTALGGHQSIRDLVRPGGRLYETRQVIIDSVEASPYLRVVAPRGAMYAFLGVDTTQVPNFDDQAFALDLLERKHVLVAPGSSFNVPYKNHFRITLLPDAATMHEVFERMGQVLTDHAEG